MFLKNSLLLSLIAFMVLGSSSPVYALKKHVSINPIKIRRTVGGDEVTRIRDYLFKIIEKTFILKKTKFIVSDHPQILVDVSISRCDTGTRSSVRQTPYHKAMGLSSTEANAIIEAYVQFFDANTNVVISAGTLEGRGSSKRASGRFNEKWEGTVDEFRGNTPIGLACQIFTDKLMKYAYRILDKVLWQGTITKIEGTDLYISSGFMDGVGIADMFSVYRKGQLISTQRLLGGTAKDRFIEVYQIEEDYAIAKPALGSEELVFSVGDIIQAMPK